MIEVYINKLRGDILLAQRIYTYRKGCVRDSTIISECYTLYGYLLEQEFYPIQVIDAEVFECSYECVGDFE